MTRTVHILPFLLFLSALSTHAFNVEVILPGGEDANKQGTATAMATQGAKEGCPSTINFPSRYPTCSLTLQTAVNEDEQSYAELVPKSAKNADLVLDIGFFAQKATHNAADQNPGKQFAIIDFEFTPPVTNIASVLFKDDEEGFLAGLLAGEVAKSRIGKVAVIGGVNQPDVRRKVNGFANGVKVSCPDCTPYCIYSKSFINDNKESDGIAASITALKGVDVVYNAASITGTMTLKKLTTENGIFGIGDITDEWVTNWAVGSVPGSEKILTSIIRDYRVMVRETIKAALNGSLLTGATTLRGVTNDSNTSVLRFADCHEACEIFNPQLKSTMEEYIKKLVSGEIKTEIDHKSGSWKIPGGSKDATQCQMLDNVSAQHAGNNTKGGSKSDAVPLKDASSRLFLFIGSFLILLIHIFMSPF